MNQQIIDYIKKSRELDHSDSDIKTLLLNAGHKEDDVRAAFDIADGKNGNSSIELPGPIILLKSTWQIYKARFWSLLSLLILPILVFGVFITISALPTLMLSALSPLVFIFLLLFFMPFAIVVLLKSAVALIFAIVTPQPVGFFEAFKISKGKALSFFWVGLLMSLVMMGGFVMLIVPGFIFLTWFSLSQFIFVAEGHKGFSALLRSKEYVSGNWGKVFLRLLFIAVISILISLVIEFGIGLISEAVAGIVSGLFSLLFAPLWLAYTFSLYQALRAKKPELVFQPVNGKKGLFVFSAVLGPIALIILSIVTIILLNPAGLLQETRDSQRINDISMLSSAITLYQATTDGILSCVPGKVYSSRDGTTAVDGTGWLPIDFTKASGGSPISALPLDPDQQIDPDSSYVYSFACDPRTNKYEIDTIPESKKYIEITSKDGGSDPNIYEVGTDLNLIK